VPEENFWTLWCKGRPTESDTLTVWLGATPSRLTSAHLHHSTIFYRPDALPAAQPTVSKYWRQLCYTITIQTISLFTCGYLCQGGYVFVIVCLSVCLFVSNFAKKTAKRICMKFSRKVGNGPLNSWLNFGGDPGHCLDSDIVFRICNGWEIRKVVNGHSFSTNKTCLGRGLHCPSASSYWICLSYIFSVISFIRIKQLGLAFRQLCIFAWWLCRAFVIDDMHIPDRVLKVNSRQSQSFNLSVRSVALVVGLILLLLS